MGDEQALGNASVEDGGGLGSGENGGDLGTDKLAVERGALGEHGRDALGVVHVGNVRLGDGGGRLLGDAGEDLVEDLALGLGEVGVPLALGNGGEDGLTGDGGGGHGGTPFWLAGVGNPLLPFLSPSNCLLIYSDLTCRQPRIPKC